MSLPDGWQRPKRPLSPLTDPREVLAAGTEAAGSPQPACGDRPGTETSWLPFTDAGRHFYALMVIGPNAPRGVHEEAFGLLDSVRFDPAVQPDWPSSG